MECFRYTPPLPFRRSRFASRTKNGHPIFYFWSEYLQALPAIILSHSHKQTVNLKIRHVTLITVLTAH